MIARLNCAFTGLGQKLIFLEPIGVQIARLLARVSTGLGQELIFLEPIGVQITRLLATVSK